MLIELFGYAFFQRALLAGIMMGILAPLIGIFFVARRQAFFSDTLAHASLAGVALGVVLGIQSVWAAMAAALGAAIGMEWLRRHAKLSGDAALALVLSGSLAFAVVLLSVTGSWNAQVLSYLFGSITTVTWGDVCSIGAVLGVVGSVLYVGRGIFFLATADARLAKVQGLPIERYEALFIMLSALVVAVGMRVVGALLVSALLVIPVLAANMWRKGFWHTMGIGVGYGVTAVLGGLFASALVDTPTGATIVLVSLLLFGVTALIRKR
ncbi:metal ABC transporter permease [bacterium]|nr:metal ABC transporter permease [bacterium]